MYCLLSDLIYECRQNQVSRRSPPPEDNELYRLIGLISQTAARVSQSVLTKSAGVHILKLLVMHQSHMLQADKIRVCRYEQARTNFGYVSHSWRIYISGRNDTLTVFQTSDARKKSQVYSTVGLVTPRKVNSTAALGSQFMIKSGKFEHLSLIRMTFL